jgi:phosphoglycerate dehydrogenase-like enzyme
MKEVLILQPLGVSRETAEESFCRILPGHKIIWENNDLNNGQAVASLWADAEYLVTVNHPITAEAIESPRLKMISVSFTGYNHIDLAACRRRGIAVCNVPGYSTNSVAELTLALAISIYRKIPCGNEIVHKSNWTASEPGIELFGKTVGIIGTGEIGLATARLFKACGCSVLGYSRSPKKEFISLGGEYRPLDELLSFSDIISLHIPLNDQTRNAINAHKLKLVKPSAILLNVSRGGLINEQALTDCLKNGKLAAAGLDVFETEPLPKDSPLMAAPNILFTPHIGYKTREALQRKADITFNNIADFEKGLKTNRVD